jgi:hypothetical protein
VRERYELHSGGGGNTQYLGAEGVTVIVKVFKTNYFTPDILKIPS